MPTVDAIAVLRKRPVFPFRQPHPSGPTQDPISRHFLARHTANDCALNSAISIENPQKKIARHTRPKE